MRARIAVVIGLVVALVLGGSGVAFAYWTATSSVGSTASAATVGVTQALSSSTLAVTYNSTTTAASGVVTVTNTSTRDASYTLTATATSASSALRSAVAVAIGTATTCTPTATLTSAVTGTFAAAVTKTGTLAAGASVALCVKTSTTAAAVTANPGTSLAATIATGVTVGTWTASATPITFTQSVAGSTAVTIDGSAWYWMWTTVTTGKCLEARWYGNTDPKYLWQEACADLGPASDENELWRFDAVSGNSGYYRIVGKYNTNQWWSVDSAVAGAAVKTDGGNQQRAQWAVLSNGNGTVRFANRADPTLCVSIVGGSTANGALMELATCNASSAAQSFTLDMLEIVVPPSITLTCSGDGGYNVVYSWPQLSGYQGQTVYRVLVNGAVTTAYSGATGWDTNLRFSSQSFMAAYPNGTYAIEVQQSVQGGAWTRTGTGTLIRSASVPYLSCG